MLSSVCCRYQQNKPQHEESHHIRLAHSIQKRLCPQGTRAAMTSLSKHTEQSRLSFRLVPEEVEEEEEDDEEAEESQGTPGR
ncbi:hypothetical protein EYF80_014168 [Liparis tanakae]|uniref:Uncharacterized protein n=1 Tax=Liparis tanakae TaxID=230148 RepID=A0A4Z2IC65_9TELE|nr:hypothetical protein EYF80_014168 [Liparis tanakae]